MEKDFPKKLPTHYTDIIQKKFDERVARNQHYSLRAYARDLNLTPGHLSEILKGKSSISLAKAESLAPKLDLGEEDQKLFQRLVEISKASEKDKTVLKNTIYNFDSSYVNISNELYSSISQWPSLAFLELISVADFRYDLKWISQRLSITLDETQDLIEHLLDSGIIELMNGEIKKKHDYFALPSNNGSKNAKIFHHTVLEKASIALEEQPSHERDFSASFLHLKKEDIPEISERIKKFRRELAREFETDESADCVYMLGTQFFRVDSHSI